MMAPMLAMSIAQGLIDVAVIHGCSQFEGVCARDGTVGEGMAADQ